VVQAVTTVLQKAKTYHFLTSFLSIHKAFRNNIWGEEFISEIKYKMSRFLIKDIKHRDRDMLHACTL
jgi:hypothetical protein